MCQDRLNRIPGLVAKWLQQAETMNIIQNPSPNPLEVADENHKINFHWPNE
jgi:hypothetical protein